MFLLLFLFNFSALYFCYWGYPFVHCGLNNRNSWQWLASFNSEQKSTGEKVVVKKLLLSSRSDEKQKFFKEAKLLNCLSHKNITSFKKVCIEPPAIMMEFLAFEFKCFCADGENKQVNSLQVSWPFGWEQRCWCISRNGVLKDCPWYSWWLTVFTRVKRISQRFEDR